MTNQNRIVFLSVPESLRGQIETPDHAHSHSPGEEPEDAFTIDPAIPIPVELAPGETTLDVEELSWEMILSGMIRVIGENPNHEDAGYYRRFVLSVRPDILGEFTEVAILKARNGDYGMAQEILAALRGLFPQSPVVLLDQALVLEIQADALEQAGREQDAEAVKELAQRAYQEVLALTPPFPDGLFSAGFFFMKRRNFGGAKSCFSAYVSLGEDPEKKERAEFLIREIEGRSLDDAIFQEAYDCIRRGEEQRGLEKIRKFLTQHPEVWNGWFILGWGLRRLARWEDGAAAFSKALELGGDNSDTRNELAICLMEMGDLKGARKELEAALREEPENVKIISNLGVLAMKDGNDDEASAFFRTVLELEPADPLASAYLRGEYPEGIG
ncbi:MAG: tetratricopeptide repeat protein [Treponema sp.]|jgi:tetratricopeptide (TPR) repeat protein|nr:tetratricopeptide repeat protein [Treponema sp.]